MLNSLAAIAVATELGVPDEAIARALANFQGIDRRLQPVADLDLPPGRVSIVDDYGHHPTEIRATLEAAADLGFDRIVCVFQPHRYTRTQALLEEFSRAFFSADVVVITDIYAASETPIPGVSGQSLVDAILAHGQREAHYVPRIEDLPRALDGLTASGDVLMTFGAGSITNVGPQFLAL